MSLEASLPTPKHEEILEEEEEDAGTLNGTKSSIMPEEQTSMERKQSIIKMDMERQITADPISLKNLSNLKFKSTSLPASANTSPKLPSSTSIRNLLNSMRWLNRNQNQNQNSPCHHSIRITPFTLSRSKLQRCKSSCEARTCRPSIELELWMKNSRVESKGNKGDRIDIDGKESAAKCVKNQDPCEERFKCGAMCLFLPSFTKGKQVKAKMVGGHSEKEIVSRVVSLEKFECGSWSSCGLNDEDGGINLYFDLPLEMIKSGINDAHSPITTAFVFDRERVSAPHGVLTKSPSASSFSRVSRSSHESASRHVRFSASQTPSHPSSPTCITPRLRQAREQFNAYLAAT